MNASFPVQVSDFPLGTSWAPVNKLRRQTFPWSSIVRAAMVAGYHDLASLPSRQFARWRTAALRMALRHSSGALIQPPEWPRLDPSEKAAVSSLLGVVVTKLLVERLLNAPVFLFLDVHFDVRFPPGVAHIRPDFAAMTPAEEWLSVEAKGKSRFRRATLDNGKLQARSLGRVNGRSVLTSVVCVTSFRGGGMEARFADPAPDSEESAELHVEPMEALLRYYSRLDRFREFSERMGESSVANENLSLELWRSRELDVDFGIIPALERALRERDADYALAILKGLTGPRVAVDHPSLGPDGIVVIPGESWQMEDV